MVVRDTPHAVVNHPRVVASYLGTTEEVIQRSGSLDDSSELVAVAALIGASGGAATATAIEVETRPERPLRPARKSTSGAGANSAAAKKASTNGDKAAAPTKKAPAKKSSR